MRTLVRDIPHQDVITFDNVSVRADAVVYFKVVDAEKAFCSVENFEQATTDLAASKIREVLSQNEINQILHHREKFGETIMKDVQEMVADWGILVTAIRLKDIQFNEGMIRAMAKKAEAERLREATIIHADAQLQTASKLLEAAQVLEKSPIAFRLRELDVLAQMAKENSHSTIVVPSSALDVVKNVGDVLNK